MKTLKMIFGVLMIFIGFSAIIVEIAFCNNLCTNIIRPVGGTATKIFGCNSFCLVWPLVIGAVMILIGLFLLISLLSIQK